MKRLILIFGMAFLLISSNVFAAGTVSQSITFVSKDMMQLVFTCTGDASDGSIEDTDTTDGRIYGMYIYRVIVENDSDDADVTDDSDVYILDAGGTDMLNGQGVDQLDDNTRNYIRPCRYEPIVGPLTLDVDNQSEASGVYTVTLIIGK